MPVRLIGLRAEQLEPTAGAGQQLTIDGTEDNWRIAEEALDKVNLKFGRGGVMPAALLPSAQRGIKPGRNQVSSGDAGGETGSAKSGRKHPETGRKDEGT
jgi:DNA polymerase-4